MISRICIQDYIYYILEPLGLDEWITLQMILKWLIWKERIGLTLILLTWRIWWAPKNANKRQMGFNWAFKGLICLRSGNAGIYFVNVEVKFWDSRNLKNFKTENLQNSRSLFVHRILTQYQVMYNFRFTILINTNNTSNYQSTNETHYTQQNTTITTHKGSQLLILTETRYQLQPSNKQLHTEHTPLRTIILQ